MCARLVYLTGCEALGVAAICVGHVSVYILSDRVGTIEFSLEDPKNKKPY